LKFFCTDNTWDTLFKLILLLGCIISSLILGTSSDIYGRRIVFIITSVFHLVGYLGMFIPDKWVSTVSRFFIGSGHVAVFILYILFLETCSDSSRLRLGLLVLLAVPATNIICFLLRYTVSYWKTIHLVNTSMLIALPVGICFTTESPRWLMFIGNKPMAWKILETFNNSTEINFDDMLTPVSERPNAMEIFKNLTKPLFRERILSLTLIYFFSSISFNDGESSLRKGLEVNGQDFYAVLFLTQVIASPLIYFLAVRFGRKKTICTVFCILIFLDGVLFMENQYFDKMHIYPPFLYCYLALSECVFIILVFYTIEIFPTPFRATVLSMCLASYCLGCFAQIYFDTVFPNSVPIDTIHLNNGQDQLRLSQESAQEMLESIFGELKTEDEIEFIKALHATGKLSVRMLILFIITSWYLAAIHLNRVGLDPASSLVVRCEIPEFEECFSFNQVLEISVANKSPTYQSSVMGKEYCTYDVRDYANLRNKYKCNYNLIKEAIEKESQHVKQESCKAFVVDNKGSTKDNSTFALSTIVEEFELFCNNRTWNQVFTSIPFYGHVLIFPFSSIPADIYGRKPIFIITSSLYLLGLFALLIPAKAFLIIGKLLLVNGPASFTVIHVLFI
ncbi:hypothetical protein ILUMI_09596, partial [Ignelater luminosus]